MRNPSTRPPYESGHVWTPVSLLRPDHYTPPGFVVGALHDSLMCGSLREWRKPAEEIA